MWPWVNHHAMPGDFDLNPIEEQILQFVRDNPGKSKSDVVRYLKERHIAARIATLAHIDRLEGKRMIICQLENPNSQIYKIYINKDNKLATVITELEEFKEAYISLLEKSKKMLDSRDYSADAKMLGIKETDPAKWSEKIKIQYHNFWYEKHVEASRQWSNKVENRVVVKDGKPVKEYLEIVRMFTENPLYLILNPTLWFYAMADTIFFRSMIKWPKEINNEEVLLQMYSITHKKVAEIQLELSRFLGSIKWSSLDPVSNLIFYRYAGDKSALWSTVYFYHNLDMDSEIRQVIKSIIKLNEEIKDLELLSLDTEEPLLLHELKEFAKDPDELRSLKEILIGHGYNRIITTKERG